MGCLVELPLKLRPAACDADDEAGEFECEDDDDELLLVLRRADVAEADVVEQMLLLLCPLLLAAVAEADMEVLFVLPVGGDRGDNKCSGL